MGEPDCCLSCKTAASATIGNRPLRIRTVGGVGGRREYPHASYPIDSFSHFEKSDHSADMGRAKSPFPPDRTSLPA